MKVKIGLIFGLIFSANAITAEVSICEKTGLPKIVNASVNDIIKPMDKLNDDEIRNIALNLCGHIKFASSAGFSPKKFKEIILKDIGAPSNLSEKEKNQKVSKFLTENKNKLVCAKNHLKKDSRELHLYKTAILDGVIDLYDEILTDDEDYEIDLNAYQIVDGKKETVIDYLDKVLAGKFSGSDELELLRDDLIDMGAKRGVDLL